MGWKSKELNHPQLIYVQKLIRLREAEVHSIEEGKTETALFTTANKNRREN